MSNTQNNPIFGVLCLPSLVFGLGIPSLADFQQSCQLDDLIAQLDDLIASLSIKIKGFGRKLGRKFIRFLKSEGPLQGDS